jgi:GntR family transcriptional regulator
MPPASSTVLPRTKEGSVQTAYRVRRRVPNGTPPAYRRIVEIISERLASGFYAPGSRLPSESQLCAEFGVSHMTLRRALTILANRNLVWAEKGKGTFVRSFDLGDSVFTLKQLADALPLESTEVRLLSASTIPATEAVAAKLAVPKGDYVIHRRRMALSEGVPALYHWEYAPYDPRWPLVDSLFPATSLCGLLHTPRGEGAPRGQVSLQATTLGAKAARALGRPPRSPALQIEHLFQDVAGRPLSWGCLVLRADLFTLRTQLGLRRHEE